MIIQKSRNLGFTIVELIIVISVIAILAALTTVAYNGIQAGAKDKTVLSDLENMDAAQTRYSLLSGTNGKAYYSGSGYDADLDFKPSGSDVIDVVVDSSGYCIRGYNPSGNKNTIDNSFTKESQPGVCIDLAPSVAAGGTGTSSLMGWWKFNGNANDYSGNNNNGTVTGATLTTGQGNKNSGAYLFNGVNNYITTTYTSALDVGQPGITMSAWINPSYLTGTQEVFGRNGPYLLWLNNTLVHPGILSGSWYWLDSTTPALQLNQWQFISMTFDGTSMIIYINGAQSGPVTTQYSGNLTISGGGVSVGRDACCGGRFYFNGSIDDTRIYNRALSASEILTLYQAGAQ